MNHRIDLLRQAAVRPPLSYEEFYLHFYRFIQGRDEPLELRVAHASAYAYENTRVHISDGELIVGRSVNDLTEEERAEWEEMKQGIVKELDAGGEMDSHMSVDYELLLREGASGVAARIDALMAETDDEEKLIFYEACKIELRGMVRFSQRYAQEARSQAAACQDAQRRKELEHIAGICDHVPEFPARTFHEAVQATHFLSFCLTFGPLRWHSWRQFQLGHIDRYLLPYYEADRAAGILTDEDAQELINCLAIQINNREPAGLSGGYMVGGRDSKGNIVVNPLTWMGLKAIDDVRLVYPAVDLCWTEGMPIELLDYACEILSHGRSHPAIFNDDLITAGLMHYGVPEKEARNYIHSNCVEITPCAASNCWVASPYYNTVKYLLEALDGEYDSFDALLNAWFQRMDAELQREYVRHNELRKIRMRKGSNPLLSCFVNDCLSRGRDMDRGGAKYNWIMPSFVGLANLVDSLYALREVVFERREMTLPQIRKMLDANFEGYEEARLRLLNGCAKYGNDIDEVDALYGAIIDHLVAECRQYTALLPEGRIVPGAFCWTRHEYFGRTTGATPDGRKAGFPLGDGSGPCQGREMNGPTASILSSTKWSHQEMLGGIAVNMKFTRKNFNAQSRKVVLSLIQAYLKRGGFEIQINVVDRETLLRAQQEPENYRDLVVRIGGYSDYFVRLSPDMQSEVLLRTAHEV